MNDFETFFSSLMQHPSQETVLKIMGKDRKIKGMIKLESLNMLGNPYVKLTFIDGSFLLIMINDQELYFAESIVGHIQEIPDEDIGEREILIYQGKEYKLGNKNDYQYVICRYVGGFFDVEGEARFSDYFPIEGTKEFLSLGWLTYDNKRADINPKLITLDQIELLN